MIVADHVHDVSFDTSQNIALRLCKNQRIRFGGTITSVLSVFVTCQVGLENVTVLQD